jgi:hypothetical protein
MQVYPIKLAKDFISFMHLCIHAQTKRDFNEEIGVRMDFSGDHLRLNTPIQKRRTIEENVYI